MIKVHLDTDFAGDTDDAAALALLLGWPDVDLVAVTTVADPTGWRAGYVRSFLALAGRRDIRVFAGAGASLTTGGEMGGLPDHATYWGDVVVTPEPADADGARDALARSVNEGAVIVGIGPYTNLARVESLAGAPVVLMGGWIDAPAPGLPQWGPDMDWNVQCDTRAAATVFDATPDLTVATLPATLASHVCASDVPRLEAAGAIGRLLARQALAHGDEYQMRTLGHGHSALPDDLLNFQYDPVACAVALGWTGARVASMRLRPQMDGDVLRFNRADDGKVVNVVTQVDGPAFAEAWLSAVERLP